MNEFPNLQVPNTSGILNVLRKKQTLCSVKYHHINMYCMMLCMERMKTQTHGDLNIKLSLHLIVPIVSISR